MKDLTIQKKRLENVTLKQGHNRKAMKILNKNIIEKKLYQSQTI